MRDQEIEELRTAVAALEGQRGTLGDTVVSLAVAPLRARLGELLRPAGLQLRQVTVLFADVVGSIAQAQDADAEEPLDLLSGALERMATLVEAHRGRVLRFTGAGIKAAFGMDEAREDDAERAVRAGLAILAAGRELAQDAQRLHGDGDFNLRVGVHTGEVALGAGIEADNTALGAAVHIAARMEQSAPPGALRISHVTWGLVRGLFALEAQPPLPVKGLDAPMQTYLVRAALERSVATVERGLQGLATPMVGRQAELQRLLEVTSRARDTRQLQALTLIGEAGLGKSRLLRELTARLLASPAGCHLLTLRSRPDGQLRPWGLVRALLATEFGVADTDDADMARNKVVAGLSPWFDAGSDRAGGDGERPAQLIGQLSGLDFGDSPHLRGLDPRSLRDQAFAALRSYLQRLATQAGGLVVLIAEDLHWADDGSLDLLQHLMANADGLPLGLVMSARPALLERRPGWAPAEACLRLGPLAAASSDELARALLQRIGDLPPRLTELIVTSAEGNPYYMEELLRRLIDDGVVVAREPSWTVRQERLDSLRLPGTLVGLLQARLDALPAGERQAARQASIIGHVFWDDALRALDPDAPGALPGLQRAAFVRLHGSSDFEGTAERQFDHHLLHQVTYETLLKAERRRGHGAAARWLAARTAGRGAEFLAMTGEHAALAGETALAIDCFEQAGTEARKRFANTAAVAWLRRAVDLLGEAAPERRVALLMQLNDVADTLGTRALQDEALQAVAAILARHPDDRRQAQLLFAQALLADRRSDPATSEQLSRRCFALAERCQAPQWAALAQGNLAWLHIVRQDLAGARRHIDIGLPWAGRIDREVVRVETEAKLLTLSGMVSILLCAMDDAHAALTAVLARGEALDIPRLQLGALDNLALVDGNLGRWAASVAWAERMCDIARRIDSPRSLASAQLRLARAAEAQGDSARAVELHAGNLAVFRATDDRRMTAVTLQLLSGAQLELGDPQAALQTAAEARALLRTVQEPQHACEAEGTIALCELRLGRDQAARATVDALLARWPAALAQVPTRETITLRWRCVQVLQALGDARCGPLLERLAADVQAAAAELAPASDRERLIQALPVFRAVVAEQARHAAAGPGRPAADPQQPPLQPRTH
jgi:class 3 adenylate cyclase/tetratricopeptide (TPR) repeat protein